MKIKLQKREEALKEVLIKIRDKTKRNKTRKE
jgi:hypothetical protein